jgi:4-hydroxyphenylacetate 3-monooxygenase
MLPSSAADYSDTELSALFSAVQIAADGRSPVDRVKLMKLAWDAVGSEFASRHTQYEMFYAGAQFVTRGHSFRTYDWEQAKSLVTTITDRYDLAGSLPPAN